MFVVITFCTELMVSNELLLFRIVAIESYVDIDGLFV